MNNIDFEYRFDEMANKCCYIYLCFCVWLAKVLKGDQEVGGFDNSQDGWIILFSRDPTASDLFKLVPHGESESGKEEKHPQLSGLVFSTIGSLHCF